MALYHFSVKMISRSKGRSSTACSAYRAGLDITDERTGERFNYANKGKNGVLDHAILTPTRAPEWAKEASSLWNAVEAFEKRKDSQVARETIVALPHELTLEQNRALLHGFVKDAYIKRGMVAQIDIHAPDGKGDNRNIHAHIMTTTRQITRNGFKAKKARNWNEVATLKENRLLWEKHVNRALEKAGHSERVDSRSFKDRDIDKMPSVHMGVEATAMERRGEDNRQGEKNRAVQAFNQNLEKLKDQSREVETNITHIEERLKQARRKSRAKRAEKREQRQYRAKLRASRRKASSENQTEMTHPPDQQRKNARYKLELRQREEFYAFETKMADQKSREQDKLNAFYKPHEHQRKLREAERDLNKHQGVFARVTGKTKALKQDVADLKRNLESLEQTREQTMSLFKNRVSQERHALTQRHKQELTAFDRQPVQKTGTAKTFEKEVLRKEVANQNPQQRKTPTPEKEKGSVNPTFETAVLREGKNPANKNVKRPTKARTRSRSKGRQL
ncbi:MAG: MobA/MobL family protein [Bacteroidetes bacterium]|nr:MobA/MobL family protein [Bacteroidota bacterium]